MADEFVPPDLKGYQGQKLMVERLEVKVASALERDEALGHMVLAGPPGSGKTTLAKVIANMMGLPLHSVIMPITQRALARIVAGFSGILFLDELHDLPPKQQATLLPLLQFGYLATTAGGRIPNDYLTVIGATTERRKVIAPLLQRCWVPYVESYTTEQMTAIVTGMLRMADIELAPDTVVLMAGAAGGIPRQAEHLVTDARDLWIKFRREPTAGEILHHSGTTADGLNELHLDYLRTLNKFGGSAGIAMLATMLQLSQPAVMELERALFDRELVTVASGVGRELTAAGMHMVARPSRLRR